MMPNQKLVLSARWAFRYFYYTDQANAAMHHAKVKFSPITFRLAEALAEYTDEDMEVGEVIADKGQYEEDPGR